MNTISVDGKTTALVGSSAWGGGSRSMEVLEQIRENMEVPWLTLRGIMKEARGGAASQREMGGRAVPRI